jgi:membrane protein involved in D-alanine export
MLPFTDIDFFLFALLYVVIMWVFKFLLQDEHYPLVTSVITSVYFAFYFRYSAALLGYVAGSYLFTSYLAKNANHKLWSSAILFLPMILFKLHVEMPFIYFAGLSFVSFRAVQVLLDHDYKSKISFTDYFNFLCFIPSFYIGPLDRFKRFSENSRTGFTQMNPVNAEQGLQQLAVGILYKFVIAECISRYWLNAGLFNESKTAFFFNDMYAYTIYLFFDFAGYSAMAIGMAKLIGIHLPMNFNAPFLAVNPPDFWQRWHASLTNWLTDYLFKPFYKWLNSFQKLKKAPLTRQNIAIFITLCAMGCWNGFEINFVLSGLIYGLFSVGHNIYQYKCRVNDKDVLFGNLSPVAVRYIFIFIMFNLACYALYVFSGRLIH